MKSSTRFARAAFVVALLACLAVQPSRSGAGVSDEDFRRAFDLPHGPESVVTDILTREEFRDREYDSLMEWLRWYVKELVRRGLAWLSERSWNTKGVRLEQGSIPLIADALLIGGLILAAIGLIWAGATFVLRWRSTRSGNLSVEENQPGETLTSARARQVAAAMAEKGRYGEAVIHTFRFVVFSLDEAGRVKIGPEKTASEILSAVKADPAIHVPFSQLVPTFNRVRYGEAVCGQEEYERFLLLSREATQGIVKP
ncbi:MAG: DUF4129 domain-containing protein [Thermodesulfobacteriota bacterium]